MSQSTTSTVLKALTDSILDKPPYVSGTLPLPLEYFHLYYRTANGSIHLNLATATETQLDELAAACEPATFGRNKEDVLDESYRKAGKMNTDHFSSPIVPERTELMRAIRDELLEGDNSSRPIKVELYKLNVYGKGSFFRAHVDTPRGDSMFGSLVLVLPTPHEGGSLILRHHSEEWSIDSGKVAASTADPAVMFIAFYSDVEHEVSLVESGHRVTLTYNLYYDDMEIKDKPSPSRTGVPSISAANETLFKVALHNALCDASFLPEGGLLGFALRHKYPVKNILTLKQLSVLFKGSDAVIWRTCKGFSLETSVYFSCVDDDEERTGWVRVVFDSYPEFDDLQVEIDEGGLIGHLRESFSATVIETSSNEDSQASSDDENNDECDKHGHEQEDDQVGSDMTEKSGGVEWGPVIWVTRGQESCTSVETPYLLYGNEATIAYCYATVCLFVDFPNVDERRERGFVEGRSDST